MTKNVILWILKVIAAVIMLQTLYFKFTAHPDSVHIFSQLGIEPWGRILTGVFEIVASVLILWPRTQVFGALTGAGIMAGAVLSHLAVLGIETNGDGGKLFMLALIVFICCVLILFFNKSEIANLLRKF